MSRIHLLLLAGVVLSATSSIFVKFVHAHAFVISFYRVFFAGLIWLLFLAPRLKRELRGLDRGQWGLSFLSGLSLACYYGAWISSLSHTSIANASVLGGLCPVFVALISWLVFKAGISRRAMAGIGLCVAGSFLLVAGKMEFGMAGIRGDLLALLGAFCISGYYMAGGHLRRSMALKTYITLVYLSAALVLFVLVRLAELPLAGYGAGETVVMIAHAVACSVLGHGIYNYVLEKLPPVTLALATLAEPVFAVAFAMVVFRESLDLATLAGMVVILGGLVIYHLPAKG